MAVTRVTAALFMQGTITALKPSGRGRILVYLDGDPSLKLAKGLAARLRVWQQLGLDQVSELQARDRQDSAYRRALRLLARRPRSERELQIRFDRMGLAEVDQNELMGRLREAKLVDDEEFAAAWLENRMEFRPRGAGALWAELRRKGVPEQIIHSALKGYDEQAAALRAARLGARRFEHLSPERFRQRLSAYLSRRGFQHPTISPLIEQLAAERAMESEEST